MVTMIISQFLEPTVNIIPPPELTNSPQFIQGTPSDPTVQSIINNLNNQVTTNNIVKSNHGLMDKIGELKDQITQLGTDIHTILTAIGKTIYYLTHPKVLAWMLWCGLVKYSFWICIFVCLLATIAYIIGWKKGKKIAVGSFMFYVIIEMFNVALK